eukprot:scaffold68662_cov59-Phaeocystis_antarctica.AAC.2
MSTTRHGEGCAVCEERGEGFCLLVVARARANVQVLGDVERCVAQFVIPRLGPVQPRRHKVRGAVRAVSKRGRCIVGPDGCVAFLEARSVQKGGGQEREGDEAEVLVSGQKLLGRLHTCIRMGLW